MAKAKKYSDWSIVLVIVLLLVVTNIYWMLAVRDINDRLDDQAAVINALTADATDQ